MGFIRLHVICLLSVIITIISQHQLNGGKVEPRTPKWKVDKNGNWKWAPGCSFFGGDLDKIQLKKSSSCPSLCYQDDRCSHFTYMNGYCHLKTMKHESAPGSTAMQNNPEGLCGYLIERKVVENWEVGEDDTRIRSSTQCDFPFDAYNIESKFMIFSKNCGAYCLANERCTHFSFKLSLCFIKEIRGIPVVEIVDNSVPICGYIPKRVKPAAATQSAAVTTIAPKRKSKTKLTSIPLSSSKTIHDKSQKQPSLLTTQKQNNKMTKTQKLELLWNDEFSVDDLSSSKNWKHVVGVTSTGFQYYTNDKENSYVKNGILHIKPTLTADRFKKGFLTGGVLDLTDEGCDPSTDDGKQCIVSAIDSDDIINPIASAMLSTENSFQFSFGTIEFRAKMPKGDWISTEISLLPVSEAYGPWPRSGEIELLRIQSNRRINCSNIPSGHQKATSTLYWGPSKDAENIAPFVATKINQSPSNVDFSSDFHDFRMDWTPTGFKFYVDGEKIGQLKVPEDGLWKLVANDTSKPKDHPWTAGSKMAPFDKPFFLTVGVSVGGSLFRDSCEYEQPNGKPWSSEDPKPMQQFWDAKKEWFPTWKADQSKNALQIDYIRVYGKNNTNTNNV